MSLSTAFRGGIGEIDRGGAVAVARRKRRQRRAALRQLREVVAGAMRVPRVQAGLFGRRRFRPQSHRARFARELRECTRIESETKPKPLIFTADFADSIWIKPKARMIDGSDQNPLDCGMRIWIPYLRKSASSAVKILVAWEALPEILLEMRGSPTLRYALADRLSVPIREIRGVRFLKSGCGRATSNVSWWVKLP